MFKEKEIKLTKSEVTGKKQQNKHVNTVLLPPHMFKDSWYVTGVD